MAYVADPTSTISTATDLVDRFGPIPMNRIVTDPAPGTATVDDVVRLDDHEDRICELIDGILVEKTMGLYESFLAVELVTRMHEYVKKHQLGIVAGADGMMQLIPDQVRIPDASFTSWESLKESGFPELAAPHMAPDLAAEVISRSNTTEEMDRKLREYFEAGTRLVWYFYPNDRTVIVYTSPDTHRKLTVGDMLDGGDVLPGFELSLEEFYRPPADARK
jgi:Uma2 family endonuclease